MRVSLSTGQRIKRVQIDQQQLEMFENSLDYYLKPLVWRNQNVGFAIIQQNIRNIIPKQQSPKKEIPLTTSCRIKSNIITQQNTEPINLKSLQSLPQRNISANLNRSYIIKQKKPSINERYRKIMDYNVEEQFVELRRLMSRQKKSSSLGKRVKFLQ